MKPLFVRAGIAVPTGILAITGRDATDGRPRLTPTRSASLSRLGVAVAGPW
jgi:hypothetical protein